MEAFGRVPQGVAQASGGGGSGHVARYTQLVRRTLGFQSEPLAQVEMLVCVYVCWWGGGVNMRVGGGAGESTARPRQLARSPSPAVHGGMVALETRKLPQL